MVTTASGTYTVEQHKRIENRVKQAFKDYWHDKISVWQLEEIKERSRLSPGEIQSIQYTASLEDRKECK